MHFGLHISLIASIMQFKQPINGIDADWAIGQHKSQAGQDLFVIAMTQGRRDGTWLEIGCCNHEYESNTWFLETHFGWSGVSMDLPSIEPGGDVMWQKFRPRARHIEHDATAFDFSTLPDRFDYLQIDIVPPENNLWVLAKVLRYQRFAVITFEHDAYGQDGCSRAARNISRELLAGAGYQMVIGDVQLPETLRFMPDCDFEFEDWWVDPQQIDADIIQTYHWPTNDHRPRTYDHILFD